MPELPEVETVKRGLEPVFAGSFFTRVTLNRDGLRFPFPDHMVTRIEGQKCIGLRRRGKYIWIDLQAGETLVVHLGMSGSFTINPTTAKPHDHVVFETDRGNKVVYHDPRRFGYMLFLPTGQEGDHAPFATMGPEPLGNNFNADDFHARLLTKKSAIKTALLDQNLVAGIGNIYACEALYHAGISPLRPCHQISMAEAEDLITAIRQVLMAALESGGSSLRDHRQTDGTMGYFQHHFQVYDRAGEICAETGGVIDRIVQGGRSTFYCPAKQQ